MPETKPLDESELMSEFSSAEQELINKLKARGDRDPEVSGLLEAWKKKEIGSLTQLTRANVEFNLKKAKLYLLAGYSKEALEELDAADYFASQLGAADLQAKVNGLFETIEK